MNSHEHGRHVLCPDHDEMVATTDFTFHPSGVAFCHRCKTRFPYYDCVCELVHDCNYKD